jgi:chromosome partitioning protein
MNIIAFINQKGGVGKTTSVINCGAGLVREGKKVLLIDLDPQAHLTLSLGIKAHELKATIYEVLKTDIDINEAIRELNGGLQLLPSSINLAAAELEFAGQPGREYLLKEALQGLDQDPDYILIDCPPSLGLFTINGLAAAYEIYIPLQTEYLALYGTGQLLEVVEVVQKRLNGQLEVTGIIGTLFDSRKNLNREVIESLKEHFKGKLFNTLIRANVSLAEAPSYGQDIFTYKPDSAGAADYKALVKEILERSGNSEQKAQVRK